MTMLITEQTTINYCTQSLDLASALAASGFRVTGVEPTGNLHCVFMIDATPEEVRWAVSDYDHGALLVNAKRLLIHRDRLKCLALQATGRLT